MKKEILDQAVVAYAGMLRVREDFDCLLMVYCFRLGGASSRGTIGCVSSETQSVFDKGGWAVRNPVIFGDRIEQMQKVSSLENQKYIS